MYCYLCYNLFCYRCDATTSPPTSANATEKRHRTIQLNMRQKSLDQKITQACFKFAVTLRICSTGNGSRHFTFPHLQGPLDANQALQTNCQSKSNANYSYFQFQQPISTQIHSAIKKSKERQKYSENDIKSLHTSSFCAVHRPSAAVPPVHSLHCQHTADPPAPDGELIIKENRLDR